MEEKYFEGTLVLEKLAEFDLVDAFFDAVDGDDFEKAATLMRAVGIDAHSIAIVLKKMKDSEDDH